MCLRVSAWNFKKPVSNIADLGALAKSHPNTFTCKHPVSLWIHNYLFVSYFIGNKISQICYSQSIIPNLGSYIFFLSNAQEWYVISLRRKSTELYSTTHRRHKPTAQIFGMQYLSQLSFLVKAVLFLPCHTFLPEKLFTKLNFPKACCFLERELCLSCPKPLKNDTVNRWTTPRGASIVLIPYALFSTVELDSIFSLVLYCIQIISFDMNAETVGNHSSTVVVFLFMWTMPHHFMRRQLCYYNL